MSESIECAMTALREVAPDGYFVGGCVRDWLLGRPLKDLDIAVPDGVEAIGRRTADRLGGVFFWLRHEMNVARVLVRGEHSLQIDIVPLAGTIDTDLRRRDFTINAMAVSNRIGLVPGAAIIDPTAGQADLAARRLRLAAPDALEQDPLRCLRAFRLRAALDLTFHPSLEGALRSAGPGLGRVSGERIRDELFVLLEGEQTARVMTDLLAHDLIASWSLPLADSVSGTGVGQSSGAPPAAAWPPGITMAQGLDRWLADLTHSLAAASDLRGTLETEVTPPRSRRALARLAALSAGARSRVGEIARTLCLSTDETRIVMRAIQGAEALRKDSPECGRERLRFSQRWEPGSVEAVLLAIAAGHAAESCPAASRTDGVDHRGSSRPGDEALIDLLGELLKRRQRPVPPLLSGEEVMAILHLMPGPPVGRYLQEVEERRADGWLRTPEEAREWLRERRQAWT